MTNKQRNEWKAAYDDRIDKIERSTMKELSFFYFDELIKDAGSLNSLLRSDFYIDPKKLEAKLLYIHTRIGKAFWRWYSTHRNIPIGKETTIEEFTEDIMERLEKFFRKLSFRMALDTQTRAKRLIDKLLETDRNFLLLNEREAVRIILRKIKRLSQVEARRMVRTQSTQAANFGIYKRAVGYYGADELVKEWIAARDSRVRIAHRQANGQVRNFTEDFHVGGEDLPFPGGGRIPENNIYCRCTFAPTPKDN